MLRNVENYLKKTLIFNLETSGVGGESTNVFNNLSLQRYSKLIHNVYSTNVEFIRFFSFEPSTKLVKLFILNFAV